MSDLSDAGVELFVSTLEDEGLALLAESKAVAVVANPARFSDDQKAAWLRIAKGARKLLERVSELVKGNDKGALADEAKKAGAGMKLAKSILDEQIAPLQQQEQEFRNAWAVAVEPLTRADVDVRNRLKAIVEEEHRAKLAEEKRLRDEADAAFKRQQEAERQAAAATMQEEKLAAQVEAARAHGEVVETLMSLPEAGPVKAKGETASLSGGEEWDFDVEDIGAFATAHPDLVEIRRGPTLKLVRSIAPKEVPGLKLKRVPKLNIR